MPSPRDKREIAEAFMAVEARHSSELDRAFAAFYPALK
jgi:hypothetical protein